ncbi:methionyl-tRNA formyltransferase [bacterium (Candidatus Howlettbacteria) CG_4_10_14_0_8_um_filter_40_9]|nr:MAG: methionyl-tRNA formyltransferase [bacterium (Candidatus Howlettbacteria) CG_4_10_14_0_8_um_filter_40_9]
MNQNLAKDIKIAYLGTPELSAVVLEDLIKDGFTISGLFCRPDKKAGRGKKVVQCPTKLVALEYDVPVFQPKDKDELTEQLKNLKSDLAIVFAYGMIIPKEAFEAPKYKTLNIHPSLLPKYRGPSPINWPILSEDKETGVSIIEIVEKMDAGHIMSQNKINIEGTDTAKTLGDKLVKLGSQMLTELIPKWIEGGFKGITQDYSQATYTRLLTKDDGRIDWSKSASEIERQIRAYTPWPGSFTSWEKGNGKKLVLKIIQTKIGDDQKNKNLKVGEVYLNDNGRLSVQTKNGSLIIEKLQLGGKNELTSEEFLRGYPDIIGTTLL